MAYGKWQIGLEIQDDAIRALALVTRPNTVRMCRWWYLPLPAGCVVAGRVVEPAVLTRLLAQWRRTLPFYHTLRPGFPAFRTLVRQIPAPAGHLNETECQSYVSGATARQLGMAPQTLALDYCSSPGGKGYTVTAAQQNEVSQLRRCITQARLNLVSLTPDACALSAFIPALPPPLRGLVNGYAGKWYLASQDYWGWAEGPAVTTFEQACAVLNLPPNEVAWCNLPESIAPPSTPSFDPWCVFTHLQPPLPRDPANWAIAIALALREPCHEAG